MANIIEEGFSLSYEVLKVGTIKPGASGEYKGQKYDSSVKFRSVNITEREDEKVGLREIEQILEFNIPCESETVAANVAESIRKARLTGVVIHIKGGMPILSEGSEIFKVKSHVLGTEFIKTLNLSSKAK